MPDGYAWGFIQILSAGLDAEFDFRQPGFPCEYTVKRADFASFDAWLDGIVDWALVEYGGAGIVAFRVGTTIFIALDFTVIGKSCDDPIDFTICTRGLINLGNIRQPRCCNG